MVWRLIVCLVLFSYIIQSKAGYCVQSDFTNLSRIKEQCTDSPPMAVILKGQINLASLLLIMGITIHFWSENILKVFISGQSGMSSGNSMTMCFVVSVNIGSRDASDRHCMTNPESLLIFRNL